MASSLRNYMLNTPDKGRLEVWELYSGGEKPWLLYVPGNGGHGQIGEVTTPQNPLLDTLVKDYNVFTYSPRMSCRSQGMPTILNALSDLEAAAQHVTTTLGTLEAAVGYSIGGYHLARALHQGGVDVKRAVLLDPTFNPLAEIPPFVSVPLQFSNATGLFPIGAIARTLRVLSKVGLGRNYALPLSREEVQECKDAVLGFLPSFFEAPSCSYIPVPTYIVLTSGTFLPRVRKHLPLARRRWQAIQTQDSKLVTLPGTDHYFTENGEPWKALTSIIPDALAFLDQ